MADAKVGENINDILCNLKFSFAFIQDLECRADVWFAERVLPHCFKSWVEFTLQRRMHKQRGHTAELYNQWVTFFFSLTCLHVVIYLQTTTRCVYSLCYQATSVQLGVLHLVGADWETQGGDAFRANGTPALNRNTNIVIIIVSNADRKLTVIRPFFTRREATCRERGLAGGNAQSSRSMRRRNGRLQTVCMCTDFFTRHWHSGRTTALRYKTGEANLVLL